MLRAALFLARFCASAWIGAATLFVIVGVLEVTHGELDAQTRDTLVGIRFPPFYSAGFLLIFLAWAGSSLAEFHPELSPRRRAFAILALLAAFGLMVVDYYWIYSPLLNMVRPAGQPKPLSFQAYHAASKYINMAGLLFAWVATFALNWPRRLTAFSDDTI